MLLDYVLTFLIPFCITLLATPLIKRLALYAGAVDHPSTRKVHDISIPRWGGISILLGILGAVWGAYYYSHAFRVNFFQIHRNDFIGISGACILMFLVGFLDDLRPLSAKLKLFFQILASLWLIYHGIKVTFITTPITHHLYFLKHYTGEILSILWIIGITNALNLLDGLDGLLAGISTISAFSLFLIAVEKGYIFPSFILIAMCGCTLAFLWYNFNPAQIFLGDSGSLFLGMLWASLSIAGALKTSTITVFVPLLILGIPILDTLLTIFRRFGKRISIFQPDKEHLHHRLLKRGWSQKKIVFVFYGAAGILSLLALIVNHWLE